MQRQQGEEAVAPACRRPGASVAQQHHRTEWRSNCISSIARGSDETLGVAVSQLEQTEGHIRRLLMSASGRRDHDHPQSVGQCLEDVRVTRSATARHLGVKLDWHIVEGLAGYRATDGPSLHAAVTNLVLNAMQEATRVDVWVALCERERLQVDVIDNGSGPADGVAADIFEPFVTSKPEGLGLGLPLVVRSARRLGGDVKWAREHGRTRFTFTAIVTGSQV